MIKQSFRLYYDAEFTSLTREGALISMAFVSEGSHTFYAEFSDYPKDQVTPWVAEHVLSRLIYQSKNSHIEKGKTHVSVKGNAKTVTREFCLWIKAFGAIEIYGDCPSYDWVFFCDLFGSALNIPESIYYIPFDLATALRFRGIDPDIDREAFVAGRLGEDFVEALKRTVLGKHNALYDALILKNMMAIMEGDNAP